MTFRQHAAQLHPGEMLGRFYAKERQVWQNLEELKAGQAFQCSQKPNKLDIFRE